MTITELKAQRRWVLHRDKIPHQPNGRRAKSNDPATWSTFEECNAVVAQSSGLGVVLGRGITGVDLDDVLVDGRLIPEAQEIVTRVNSYTEVTPSGTGLHVLAVATLPGPGIAQPLTATSAVEIKSSGFYFTWTASHLEGTPLKLMDRRAEIEVLYERFRPRLTLVSDGVPRPEAVQKFIRRFTTYAEGMGAETGVKRVGDRVVIVTAPCLLFDDHLGGVGVTPEGVRCVQCFHTRCKSLGWAQWSKQVEEKYKRPMLLDGAINWKTK